MFNFVNDINNHKYIFSTTANRKQSHKWNIPDPAWSKSTPNSPAPSRTIINLKQKQVASQFSNSREKNIATAKGKKGKNVQSFEGEKIFRKVPDSEVAVPGTAQVNHPEIQIRMRSIEGGFRAQDAAYEPECSYVC